MPKSPKLNEVACPTCKEPIAIDAARCPHCHTDFTAADIKKRKKAQTEGLLMGFGCLGLIGVIVAGLTMCSGSKAPTGSNGATPSATVNAKAPSPVDADLKGTVVTFYRDIVVALKPCQAGSKKAADVFEKTSQGSASMYDGYVAAKQQVDGCRESEEAIDALPYPSAFTGDVKDAAEKLIGSCRISAQGKRMAGETALEIYDGEVKPSKVTEFKERTEGAQSGLMLCVAMAMQLGQKTGVDLKELAKVTD